MVKFLRAFVGVFVGVCVCSHGATLVLVCVRVFEAESMLGAIFLQVGELFAVNGSTALPATQRNSPGIRNSTAWTPGVTIDTS